MKVISILLAVVNSLIGGILIFSVCSYLAVLEGTHASDKSIIE